MTFFTESTISISRVSRKNKTRGIRFSDFNVCDMYVCSVESDCDPMNYSIPGSSAHGIFKARVLQCVAISFSRGSSCPRDGTHVSCISGIGRQILYNCATWEACPWFQTILQSYSHQNRMVLAQNRHIKQWYRIESSEVNSYSYGQFVCDKKRQEARIYSRHAGQQKRHRHKEQTLGLTGRRWECNDLRECHWNMYITICKIDDQCEFNAGSRAPKAHALG